MTEMLQSQTFGTVVVQVSYLMSYGWLIAFIMPDNIASLMRITTLMGCVQYITSYISAWLQK
ncbi:hypothetical protein SDC9_133628 [bioreactor metagenome]|uniref:Uncharacterized protein n=1 Tax=bioreactor metagenome TaxID=1076179 RepID=A0A645DBF7_9ZZZZ